MASSVADSATAVSLPRNQPNSVSEEGLSDHSGLEVDFEFAPSGRTPAARQ
jgi:hypothetical protein